MLRTEEIEYGLLPTPTTMTGGAVEVTSMKKKNTFSASLHDLAKSKMLPTPTTMDSTNATVNMKSTQVKEGSMHSMTLSRMILQTPRASDKNMHWKTKNWKGDDLGSQINEIHGTRSHLSPQFVLEMMGFPTDWTLLPFLNGGQNQSKQVVTQ